MFLNIDGASKSAVQTEEVNHFQSRLPTPSDIKVASGDNSDTKEEVPQRYTDPFVPINMDNFFEKMRNEAHIDAANNILTYAAENGVEVTDEQKAQVLRGQEYIDAGDYEYGNYLINQVASEIWATTLGNSANDTFTEGNESLGFQLELDMANSEAAVAEYLKVVPIDDPIEFAKFTAFLVDSGMATPEELNRLYSLEGKYASGGGEGSLSEKEHLAEYNMILTEIMYRENKDRELNQLEPMFSEGFITEFRTASMQANAIGAVNVSRGRMSDPSLNDNYDKLMEFLKDYAAAKEAKSRHDQAIQLSSQ